MAEEQQYDFFQRWPDFRLGLRSALEGLRGDMWTSLPCRVVAPGYDATTQTVTVQPTIKGRKLERGDDGSWKWTDQSMPVLPLVPVEFPNGGGLSITFPIKVGDEGIVSFQSRALDNWWSQGGEQPQVTPNGVGSLRQHNLSDGVFRPGARSKPRALQNVSSTAVECRTDDGTAGYSFDPAAGFTIKFPGVVVSVDIHGNISTPGEITRGVGTGDAVRLGTHTHAHGPAPDPGS